MNNYNGPIITQSIYHINKWQWSWYLNHNIKNLLLINDSLCAVDQESKFMKLEYHHKDHTDSIENAEQQFYSLWVIIIQ